MKESFMNLLKKIQLALIIEKKNFFFFFDNVNIFNL